MELQSSGEFQTSCLKPSVHSRAHQSQSSMCSLHSPWKNSCCPGVYMERSSRSVSSLFIPLTTQTSVPSGRGCSPADLCVHRGSSAARGQLRAPSPELRLAQTHPLPLRGCCAAKEAPCTRVSCTAQRYKALSESSTSASRRRLYFAVVFSHVVKRPLCLEPAAA